MISITNYDTRIVVKVDVPRDINDGKAECLLCSVDLGGSQIAVRALADRLRSDLAGLIADIRRDAYRQGARDRANRAKHFHGAMRRINDKGGCW